jgi:sortase A
MPKRGSVQLLLLSFRSRARLGWGVLAGVIVLVLAFLLQTGDEFPVMTRTGLAQVIRQSVWEHALAGLPEEPWPWGESSQVTSPTVPRLGLSAAVLTGTSAGKDEHLSLPPLKPANGNGAHAPRAKVSDVEVGDRITVTAADGSSRVYKVTGRRVVDPHLAETEPKPEDAEMALVTCSPLDPLLASSLRLVIQAIKIDPPAPPEASAEQKL